MGQERIGITGSRNGPTDGQRLVLGAFMRATSFGPHEIEFHHGDCIGVDKVGYEMARDLDWFIVVHPPDNPKARARCPDWDEMRDEAPYLVRNRRIVQEVDLMIACPAEMEKPTCLRGKGTWATIGYAQQAKKRLFIIFPDGTTAHERMT